MALRVRVPLLPPMVSIRPDADDTDGTWTNESGGTTLYSSIDETTASDSDYIQSADAPVNDVCKISLGNPGYVIGQPVAVRYRYKRDDAAFPMELRVRLLEGATERASWTHTNVSNTYVTTEQTLTGAEYAAITDFNNLYLEARANYTPLKIRPNRVPTTYDEALRQGRLWTPDVLRSSGILQQWFDMDGPFTYATGISQWNDKSGRANHITQPTGAQQPTINASYMNGRPAAVFNSAANQVLAKASTTWTAQWAVLAVWQNASVSGTRNIVDGDPVTSRHGQYMRQNGAAVESIAFNTGGSAFGDATASTLVVNVPVIGSASRTSTTVEAWLNGTSNGSTGTTGTPQSGTGPLTIGSLSNNTSFYTGGISEVLKTNRELYARERQAGEGYLAWKWGLVDKLPASHPFKNRPPLIGD